MADVRVLVIAVILVLAGSFIVSHVAAFPNPSLAPTPPYDDDDSYFIIVDKSGGGNYTKIQDAVDAVPTDNLSPVDILVMPGVYEEQVVVPANKPFITMIGLDNGNRMPVITGNQSRSIIDSATLTIAASDFTGHNLTIQNTYGRGRQAVALMVTGDRVSFHGCTIFSYQDTLLDEKGRHFYSDCLIVGATDFICGNAASVYERCHLHSISANGGAITAQRRSSPAENTGFNFVDCIITGIGVNTTFLGRPWGNYSRVIFAQTFMTDAVHPKGWNDWDDPYRQRTAYFGQYDCFGPGANTTGRVMWAYNNLTSKDVENAMIDSRAGWIKGRFVPFTISS